MSHTLLVIHDSPLPAAMQETFGTSGWEIVVATTETEVLHAIGHHQPSAIVLNAGLRSIDGPALATRLKWDPLTCTLPIMVFNPSQPAPTHTETWAADVLPWPFEAAVLLAKLEECQARSTRHQPRVLVVDDEPDLVEIMMRILDDRGFRVAGACDGIQALEIARSLHPDVILLDLEMPRLNGWQVLAQLKRDERLSSTRVVIFTGAAKHPEDRQAGLSHGADAYLTKPCSTEEVVRTVQGVL